MRGSGFRVLGPLAVVIDGAPVPMPSPKQRILLASLLLQANRAVPSEDLIAQLWEEGAPADVRGALHIHITRLRKLLTSPGSAAPAVISTTPGGYLLEVSLDDVDLAQFESSAAKADRARETGDLAAERESLHHALSLWRGPALANVPSDVLQRDVVPRLVEQRLRLAERRFDIELRLGNHAEVVGELQALCAEHPLREPLWGQLMLVLHRSDRQAEALRAYHAIGKLLNEELGVNPGEQLAQLHYMMLTNDPSLSVPVTPSPQVTAKASPPDDWNVLCQLPSDTSDFVGRAEVIQQVNDLVTPAQRDKAVPIVRISGSPGVGKTALAVRVAHEVRSAFPDGQWYVRLFGGSDQPRRPADVLGELLRASGVSNTVVPEDVDARASLFRTRLADRRVLLVLDDAKDADQITPLLPGTPGSSVLITSRAQLPDLIALAGARPVGLDVLSPEEAAALLSRVLGENRVRAESAHVDELARLCAYLPLALRIAAANLASRATRSIADYVTELREGNLLVKLSAGSRSRAAVRAAFDLSYRALPPETARVFRLLGLVPGPSVTGAQAVQLAGIELDEAEQLLDELAEAHLIEPSTPGRFRFHDLLRLYAAERARAEETETERADALRRLYDWYLYTTDAAATLYYPGFVRIALPPRPANVRPPTFAGEREAVGWLDDERSSLLGMTEQAADEELLRHYTWLLADTLHGYFWLDRHYGEWVPSARAGLRAATEAGDEHGINVMRLNLGLVYWWDYGNYAEAQVYLTKALEHFERVGAQEFEAVTLNVLGLIHLHKDASGLADAPKILERALAVARTVGLLQIEAGTLRNLGSIYHNRGELARASEHYSQALEVYQRLDVHHPESDILGRIGLVYCDRGMFDEAVDHLDRAAKRSVQQELANHEAVAHYGLAMAKGHLGQYKEALQNAHHALRLSETTRFPAVEVSCLVVIGLIERATGRPGRAHSYFSDALKLARSIGHARAEIEALTGLAHQQISGDEAALDHGMDALEASRRGGFRLHEGVALWALAFVHFDLGRFDEARRYAEQARLVYHETGCGLEYSALYIPLDRIIRGSAPGTTTGTAP
jgi:DNA-binding SARP family transcriptional activator